MNKGIHAEVKDRANKFPAWTVKFRQGKLTLGKPEVVHTGCKNPLD